jgi:hypothetical protein
MAENLVLHCQKSRDPFRINLNFQMQITQLPLLRILFVMRIQQHCASGNVVNFLGVFFLKIFGVARCKVDTNYYCCHEMDKVVENELDC